MEGNEANLKLKLMRRAKNIFPKDFQKKKTFILFQNKCGE